MISPRAPFNGRRLAAGVLSTALLLTCNPATGCGGSASSNVQPALEFTSVPPAASGGPTMLAPIAGRVATRSGGGLQPVHVGRAGCRSELSRDEHGHQPVG